MGRARPGRRLEVDEDGVVWCHAPGFARFEYWRDPEATERAWRGDAFTVGDIGRLDDDGFLFLDGRRDDLIISGGVNVYPAEVESVLAEAPGVIEVAVFGVRDEEWGERVCAAVVGAARRGRSSPVCRAASGALQAPEGVLPRRRAAPHADGQTPSARPRRHVRDWASPAPDPGR